MSDFKPGDAVLCIESDGPDFGVQRGSTYIVCDVTINFVRIVSDNGSHNGEEGGYFHRRFVKAPVTAQAMANIPIGRKAEIARLVLERKIEQWP